MTLKKNKGDVGFRKFKNRMLEMLSTKELKTLLNNRGRNLDKVLTDL